MYKYIALCVCVCLCGVAADLNKEEGEPCEWEGVNGRCVKETRCVSTLYKKGIHPICSTEGDVKIICCTDCELVNDTRNMVALPYGKYIFKEKMKNNPARRCLECATIAWYTYDTKRLWSYYYDEKQKCHKFTEKMNEIDLSFHHSIAPCHEYPNQAVLGYGDDLSDAFWLAGGSILSDRFILTAAQTGEIGVSGLKVKFVALDVKHLSESPSSWQTHKVKRFIPHPEYKAPSKYHDIALIETETPINFTRNVLPACLLPENVDLDYARSITWRDVAGNDYYNIADNLQTIHLDKFSAEECKNVYENHRALPDGLDDNTQMCYGSYTMDPAACMSMAGEPLMTYKDFDYCVHIVLGVTSFGRGRCGRSSQKPDVFTRVTAYRSWIESIVWPDQETGEAGNWTESFEE
ncbi:CLIP domain-containing serine protease C9 [Helicoverpa armigera]|uniref:CLIP domain-containing serine protease C9 n=1 Tax=Helicoverpa armigera TaxID=29058 RepID=UPI003083B73A